jgi:CHAT domain-containing protein
MPQAVAYLGWICAVLVCASPVAASGHAAAEAAREAGTKAFQRGALDDAAASWMTAARSYERAGRPADQVAALIHLSQAESGLGRYGDAVRTLELALTVAANSGDGYGLASVLSALGNVHIVVGPPELAATYLDRALVMAREASASALTAATLNNRGNLFATESKHVEAVAAYRESIALAERTMDRGLAARALINAASSLRQTGQSREALGMVDRAAEHLEKMPSSHESAFARVTIGLAYRDLQTSLPESRDALALRAAQALSAAAAAADGLGDRRTSSYGWGYLGSLYEDERRYAEALQLTRRAVFAAQQANAAESLYRWQWQAGRLLHRMGNIDDALGSYRRAVASLQSIRPELTVGYGQRPTSFREAIGPVYFGLVDLLLQRAAAGQGREAVGDYLVEAREAVELFKAAELRDYFRDDCVDTALAKVATLEQASHHAAVIYPIILPDRVELLISIGQRLKSVVVPISAERLTNEVRQFRLKLEKRTTREYLPHAQRLYDWLIRPLEPDLEAAKPDTLVFVPDGALRTIPMAALHDGKEFLVSKFPLGITPGLQLTDPRPIRREHARVLAVGVTEAVQGFPALPNVAAELEMLQKTFRTTTLMDRDFLAAKFEQALKTQPFTIVHVASHGQFDADVNDTFLLTFDEKVTIDRLDRFIGVFKFRDEPLELLTLSACDTAAGDDKAALGLAGIAIKAGARSAMATLWQVHDVVAAELVAAFYKELLDPSVSRAAALQRAQVKILRDPRYEHPGFWSPFLMINSWL